MENYQMNRSGCRPYNRTCGMMNFSPVPLSQMRRETSCSEMNCESSDCTRPYKNSGDFIPVKSSYNPSISQTPNCPCTKPVSAKTDNMYEHLKHLTPAMAYVPYQNFTSAYDLDYALSVGRQCLATRGASTSIRKTFAESFSALSILYIVPS